MSLTSEEVRRKNKKTLAKVLKLTEFNNNVRVTFGNELLHVPSAKVEIKLVAKKLTSELFGNVLRKPKIYHGQKCIYYSVHTKSKGWSTCS